MGELIERLEKATGPDRDLSDEVLLACEWQTNFSLDKIEEVRTQGWKCEAEDGQEYTDTFAEFMNCACWYPRGHRPFHDSWVQGYGRPDPTASIDDALTLVPDSFHWEIKKSPHRKGYFAEVWAVGLSRVVAGIGDAPHPAIALCIAALKARATLTSTDRQT